MTVTLAAIVATCVTVVTPMLIPIVRAFVLGAVSGIATRLFSRKK